jgi:methionyl aminopeptidase
MIICIEPMLLTDSDEYFIDKKNNWTIYSKNHKLTCHNENMVLVTENGYEILNE